MDDSIRYQKTEMDEIVRNQIIVSESEEKCPKQTIASEIGSKSRKSDRTVRNPTKVSSNER